MKRFVWLVWLVMLAVILATGCISEPIANDPLRAIQKVTMPVFKSLGSTNAPTVVHDSNPSIFSCEFNTRHIREGTNGMIRIRTTSDGVWLSADLWSDDDTESKVPTTESTSYGFEYSYTVRAGKSDNLNVHLQYGSKANQEAIETIITRLEKIRNQLEEQAKRVPDAKADNDKFDRDDKGSGESRWQKLETWWGNEWDLKN